MEFMAPFKNQVLESFGESQTRVETCRDGSQRLSAISMIDTILQSCLDLQCSWTDDRR